MKSFKKSLLAGLLVSACNPVNVLAVDEHTLDTVVVSATRSEQSNISTPSSITIIRRDEIEASGATHIVDIIRGRGGVQVRDFFGDGTRAAIGMRGFTSDTASSNTLVLIDGRRLNNPDLSSPDLNSISIDNIERIEIVQGSAGTLYGDQAVAGVINIITRDIKDFSANVRVDVASYNTTRLFASASNRAKNGIGFRLSVENKNSDGYRENNELDYENITGKIDYKHSKGVVFLEHQEIYEDLNTPGALSLALVNADRRQSNGLNQFNHTDTNITRLGIRHSLSQNWDLEAELTTRKSKANADFGGGDVSTSDLELNEFTPRFIGFVPTPNGEAQFTLGADIIESKYDIASVFFGFPSSTSNKQSVRNIYGQIVIPLSNRISITTGARYSDIENDLVDSFSFPTGVDLNDNLTAAEVGISYTPTTEVRLFARADENFRFAKVNEQTFTAAGIVGLETQEGISYEFGAEWKRNQHSAKAVIYRINLDNEIDYDPSVGFSGANSNLDPTKRNGLTLEGRYQATPKLALGAQYNYVDAKFSQGVFEGNRIPFVSENTVLLTANYDISSSWKIFGELQYVGDRIQAGDFANTNQELNGYTLANLAIHYKRKNLRLSGRIKNLFDKEYSDYATFNAYYPAPEHNISLSVQYAY